MADESFRTDIRFSRELGPWNAVSLSLGILVAAATFALVGYVTAAAGPSAILSYVLMGGLFLLALLCYLELQSKSAMEGGAYILLRESLRGPWAFLAGWSVLTGGLLLCALLAAAVAAQLGAVARSYLGLQLPEPLMAALVVLALTAYHALGGRGFRRGRHFITWGAIAALLLLCMVCLPYLRLENYSPFSPRGAAGIQAGLSLLLVGFLAFEYLPLSVSEIRQPRRTIPRAYFTVIAAGTILPMLVSLVAIGTQQPWGQIAVPAAIARFCLGSYGKLLPFIGLAFIPPALNSTLLLVIRQAQVMGRDNLLPEALRYGPDRLKAPYPLLLVFGLGATLVTLLGDVQLIARLAGFFALFVMSLLALADAVRRAAVGDSPRFRLPFRPLIPALVLAVNLFLVPALGAIPLLTGSALLATGFVIYLAYAKRRYIAAQEGIVVFRETKESAKAEYRVLVPVGPAARQPHLFRLAVALVGQRGEGVLPLRVVTVPEQFALAQGARKAREIESLLAWSLAGEDTGGVSLAPITRVARSVSQGIIDTATEEECDVILVGWEGYSEGARPVRGRILDPVIENAPCDVLLVKGDVSAKVEKILVPTSGGPHASLAAKLALKLAKAYGARVTALYVCREGATAEDQQHGLDMISQTASGLETDDLLERKVVIAPGVVRGILSEAERHDLVLIGATGEGLFDRFLFGTVPERIAQRSPVPVIIAKRHAALPQFWLRRIWSATRGLFPTLEAEERSAVYRQIREGARADVDFFVMISLSAIIAALGLLLNSPAVIIGAMLVAPLMSPIIGVALAIALGNVRLLRDGAESAVKGIFLAVFIAVLLASLSPLTTANEEILSRTAPNLLDLVVALASGAAGAYAVSRKDVSAALPGVAISAALVPPLGVIGIGLAMNRAEVAGGGLLLFSTNLIAITLAGAVVFLLLGFRPARGVRERELRLRRGLVVAVLLLFAVSLPLAFIFGRAVQATQERQVIERALSQELANLEEVSLVGFELDHQRDAIALTVTVYASQQIPDGTATRLDDVITQAVGEPVTLRLIAIPVSETYVP